MLSVVEVLGVEEAPWGDEEMGVSNEPGVFEKLEVVQDSVERVELENSVPVVRNLVLGTGLLVFVSMDKNEDEVRFLVLQDLFASAVVKTPNVPQKRRNERECMLRLLVAIP